jgi:hypothetical protein
MKLQSLLALLPLVAPLICALPTAEPQPLDFNLDLALPITKSANFSAILLAALPDLSPDDDDTPSNLADDELAEESAALAPSASDLTKRASANPSITWTPDFTFKRRRRTIARGDATITFWKNGDVRFRSHFKALRVFTYNYSLTCAIRDKAGHAYTLQRKGKICGIFRSCSSVHSVDTKINNHKVEANWNSIKAGNRVMHCSAQLRWDIVGAFEMAIRKIKEYGAIVGQVIKLFAA